MKKIMTVELKMFREQSKEQGMAYVTHKWTLPVEASPDSPLEKDMQDVVYSVFPAQQRPILEHMLYNDLSQGGSLNHGNWTLSVSFQKAS